MSDKKTSSLEKIGYVKTLPIPKTLYGREESNKSVEDRTFAGSKGPESV